MTQCDLQFSHAFLSSQECYGFSQMHHLPIYRVLEIWENDNNYNSSLELLSGTQVVSMAQPRCRKPHLDAKSANAHLITNAVLILLQCHHLKVEGQKMSLIHAHSSFIPRTCNLWNILPFSCFPESYNLPSFKSKINKLDLFSLSS